MPEAKPYAISKQVVWEAYQEVKANHGAAGVDGQSIEAFETDLKNKELFQNFFSSVGCHFLCGRTM
jgi:retron-type reverse transcriptase